MILWFCQVPSGSVRFSQIWSGLTGSLRFRLILSVEFWQISLGSDRFPQVLTNSLRFCQVQAGFVRFGQDLTGSLRFSHILSFQQILSDLVRFCHIWSDLFRCSQFPSVSDRFWQILSRSHQFYLSGPDRFPLVLTDSLRFWHVRSGFVRFGATLTGP